MLWWKPVKHRDHLAGEPQINHQWSAPHKEMLWSLEILVGGKIQGREASRFPGNMVKVQASPAFSHKLPFSAPLKSAICKSLNCQLAPPTRCTAVGGGGAHIRWPHQVPWTQAYAPQPCYQPCWLQDQPAHQSFSRSAAHTAASRNMPAPQ